MSKMNSLPVRPANAQHMGRRESQQDAFGFSNRTDPSFMRHGGFLAVLGDGMGGLENGAWAAVHGVRAYIQDYQQKSQQEAIDAAMLRSLESANAVVYAEAARLNLVGGMGSTLVAAAIRDSELHWISAGDSRIYLFQKNKLTCLSRDHSYAAILKDRAAIGEITPNDAANHPLKNQLTSHLGKVWPMPYDASRGPVHLDPGDWVLLCSDGLTGTLSDSEISAELFGEPQAACERLLGKAIGRGNQHQDNTTILLMQAGGKVDQPSAGALTRAQYHGNKAGKKPPQPVRNQPAQGGRSSFLLPGLAIAFILAAAAILYVVMQEPGQSSKESPVAQPKPEIPIAPAAPAPAAVEPSGVVPGVGQKPSQPPRVSETPPTPPVEPPPAPRDRPVQAKPPAPEVPKPKSPPPVSAPKPAKPSTLPATTATGGSRSSETATPNPAAGPSKDPGESQGTGQGTGQGVVSGTPPAVSPAAPSSSAGQTSGTSPAPAPAQKPPLKSGEASATSPAKPGGKSESTPQPSPALPGIF